MRVNAVICEYNPFHNGHKYLLDYIKKDESAAVAIMSGSFTQRGDIAVTDKFNRAEIAVKNGSDLVIELPTVYACAGAQTFANRAVQIAEALGIVDSLCFGAENSDAALLTQAAQSFENDEFKSELRRNMDSGDYYPNAAQKALEKVFSPELAEIISKPNNILAVEYIKALKYSSIKPMAVKRVGINHDSEEENGIFTSAANIRKMIVDKSDYSRYVPNYTINNAADISRLERAILYKLRTMSKEEISRLPDVSEGLENRIYDAVKVSASLNELFEYIKTKRYTMARIRRIIIAALLGITSDLQKQDAPYIRVLAFNEVGERLMSDIKKKGSLPLITNVSDGYNKLSTAARRVFDIDILASDIFNLATDNIGICKTDFTKGIIKI